MMDGSTIRVNVERVRDRIAGAGRDPESVGLVAVTKGQPVAVARAAVEAGLVDLGENYAQELEAKAVGVADAVGEVRWHFIGQLQRNKVRHVAHLVSVWQSVDRLRLGEEIARHQPGAGVLVQVNLTEDPNRGGTRPGLAAGLVDGLRDLGLDVRGLMAVAPMGDEPTVREGFRIVVDLADRLALPERSIGMSDDFELAVQEGSTMVRIGSALFGPRPRVASPGVEN
jgi:pyridoxal phosphate enzyme (YggS family)